MRVVADRDQLAQEVSRSLRASLEVQSSGLSVQRPRVPIKSFALTCRTFFLLGGSCSTAKHEIASYSRISRRLFFFAIRDVLGFKCRFFRSLFGLYEFVQLPTLPGPSVVVCSLCAVDQFVPVPIRQAIRVSSIVPKKDSHGVAFDQFLIIEKQHLLWPRRISSLDPTGRGEAMPGGLYVL